MQRGAPTVAQMKAQQRVLNIITLEDSTYAFQNNRAWRACLSMAVQANGRRALQLKYSYTLWLGHQRSLAQIGQGGGTPYIAACSWHGRRKSCVGRGYGVASEGDQRLQHTLHFLGRQIRICGRWTHLRLHDTCAKIDGALGGARVGEGSGGCEASRVGGGWRKPGMQQPAPDRLVKIEGKVHIQCTGTPHTLQFRPDKLCYYLPQAPSLFPSLGWVLRAEQARDMSPRVICDAIDAAEVLEHLGRGPKVPFVEEGMRSAEWWQEEEGSDGKHAHTKCRAAQGTTVCGRCAWRNQLEWSWGIARREDGWGCELSSIGLQLSSVAYGMAQWVRFDGARLRWVDLLSGGMVKFAAGLSDMRLSSVMFLSQQAPGYPQLTRLRRPFHQLVELSDGIILSPPTSQNGDFERFHSFQSLIGGGGDYIDVWGRSVQNTRGYTPT
ncbi:hypothetical protein B0H10DRAFT_1954234 [Mycena sp. CBHHK59/15]|nr:hypothetical protein B0H10DRAFT_1954234 [Mycena sp. CBHHK59/15]